MSLYVYAIAAAPVSLDGLRGVCGEPLRTVASSDGESHAVAGDFDDSPPARTTPPAVTAETLRAQDALVRELAARADALLPSRFGSNFADERTLRQTLDELAPRLERALSRVRGREQMTLRLFRDAPADDGSAEVRLEVGPEGGVGPGTRYMRRRAAEARQLPDEADLLRATVAGIIEGERVERGQSSGSPVIGSIHHLIPRGSADAYRARLDEAIASPAFAASGIRLRVSGPSPAYAFAEADLS